MKIIHVIIVSAFALVSIHASHAGDESQTPPISPTKTKTPVSKGKQSVVADSEDTLEKRVEGLQKELSALKDNFAKNADTLSAQSQKRIKGEMAGLDKRMTEIQSEMGKLAEASSEEIKSNVKKNVSSALTSAGDLLKKIGTEISK